MGRSPKNISLGEILSAVGEDTHPFPPLKPQEKLNSDWVTFSLWQRLDLKLKDALYSICLEDLYYDARSWQAAQGQSAGFIWLSTYFIETRRLDNRNNYKHRLGT